MANIKGITVEIGGDTTGLNKALESVNKTIKSTASELKDYSARLEQAKAHQEEARCKDAKKGVIQIAPYSLPVSSRFQRNKCKRSHKLAKLEGLCYNLHK